MKKLVTAALALVMGAISVTAFADEGNFFVNADAGQANYRVGTLNNSNASVNVVSDGSHLDKQDAAGALRFGYRWHGVVDYGVETGYADLGQAASRSSAPYSNIADIKSRGWILGGNLKYNIHDSWYVSARAGWFRAKLEDKGVASIFPNCSALLVCPQYIGSLHYQDSSTGTGEYLGLGAGYNFSTHFSLGLSYDNYHARPNNSHSNFGIPDGVNVALYSVSAEYRF